MQIIVETLLSLPEINKIMESIPEKDLYEYFKSHPERFELKQIPLDSRYFEDYAVYELTNLPAPEPRSKLYCTLRFDRQDQQSFKFFYYYRY